MHHDDAPVYRCTDAQVNVWGLWQRDCSKEAWATMLWKATVYPLLWGQMRLPEMQKPNESLPLLLCSAPYSYTITYPRVKSSWISTRSCALRLTRDHNMIHLKCRKLEMTGAHLMNFIVCYNDIRTCTTLSWQYQDPRRTLDWHVAASQQAMKPWTYDPNTATSFRPALGARYVSTEFGINHSYTWRGWQHTMSSQA